MSRLNLTSVFDPGLTSSARLNLGHDESFIREVARRANVDVRFIEGRLAEVGPDDGFILWSCLGNDLGEPFTAASPERASELAARFATRTVAIDASTSRIYDRLERLQVAAAIDVGSHAAWLDAARGGTGRQGLYGRRDIAALIGAACDANAGSETYGYMTSPQHEGLAHLLADYLVTLHESSEVRA